MKNPIAAWIVLGLFLALVTWMVWYSESSSDDTIDQSKGLVYRKTHRDSYYTFVLAGKVLAPIYQPEQNFLFVVNDAGQTFTVQVNKFDWEKYERGDEYPMTNNNQVEQF